MTPLDWARAYVQRGWQPVPIPSGEKGPKLPGWGKLRLGIDDLPRHFGNNCNVGIILGPPSGELVDIDLDCSEAIDLADLYLPPTGAEFGRKSKPRSHRLYVAPGAVHEAFADPLDGTTLLELRAAGRDGGCHQTVFPPSVHPSGEAIGWSSDIIAPVVIETTPLRTVSAYLAMGCLIMRYISPTAARKPALDFPKLLWEFDHDLGRPAYRWLGEPDPDAPRRTPKPRSQQSRQELDLAEVVHAIPNDCSWEDWNRIGLAIFAASGGSGQGGVIFDDWSEKSSKYDPYVTAARWDHYRKYPPGRIGMGTLVYLARQAGWRPSRASS
jgi:Primase C terminal 2 (PriCT-2)/Bifunctional DNA primase/polymerase, N-terminal